MKLKDFLTLTCSYRFGLVVFGETPTNNENYKIINYNTHEYDNCEVIYVSAIVDVEAPSPLTNAVSVRPLLCITIKKEAS